MVSDQPKMTESDVDENIHPVGRVSGRYPGDEVQKPCGGNTEEVAARRDQSAFQKTPGPIAIVRRDAGPVDQALPEPCGRNRPGHRGAHPVGQGHLSPETLQRAAEQGANYLQGKTNVTRLHLVDGEDGERSDAKDPGSMTLKPELRTKGLEVPTKGAELRTKAPELRT